MNREWWRLTWLVTRRELGDRGTAKSFWFSTALLLLAAVAGAVIPAVLQHHGRATVRIGIVGGPVAALTQTAKEAGRVSNANVVVATPASLAVAKADLRSGKLAAVLVGGSEVLVKQQSVTGGSGVATTLAQIGGVQRLFAELPPRAGARLAKQGISLPVHSLLPPGRSLTSRITGLVAVILIYIVLLVYGARIAIGVGEEKSSRVVEVLLTTLRPVQLLSGKVIGIGLMALGQVAALIGVYLLAARLAGSTAVSGASTGVVLASALWLVLGYAFYCTAYAAAGSLISRQSDAQNAVLPLQIPLILGYVLTYTVIYASSVNPFFHVLTFIPFTAPVTMPVLVAVGAAPAWQMLLSVAITLVSTVGMARLAGTIYERAILRTGGRLKVRQVLRSAA
jgi:ABC-2 type transport system permease protein